MKSLSSMFSSPASRLPLSDGISHRPSSPLPFSPRQLFIMLVIFFLGFYSHAIVFPPNLLSPATSSTSPLSPTPSSSSPLSPSSPSLSHFKSAHLLFENPDGSPIQESHPNNENENKHHKESELHNFKKNPKNAPKEEEEEIVVHIDPRELTSEQQEIIKQEEKDRVEFSKMMNSDCPPSPPCPTLSPSPPSPLPLPLSPPPLPPSRPSKNFLFGISMGYPAEIVYRFSSTARHSCPSCEILLFMDQKSLDDRDIQYVLRLTSTTSLKIKEPIGGGEGVDKSAARYYLMKEWLENYTKSLENDSSLTLPSINLLLCIDVRDTVFQRDPFALVVPFLENYNQTVANSNTNKNNIPSWGVDLNKVDLPLTPSDRQSLSSLLSTQNLQSSPFIIVFSEPQQFTIGQCSINTKWLSDSLLDMGTIGKYFPYYIICSGATMGNVEGMKIYYDVFVKDIERMRGLNRVYHGVDQGMHMSLVYRKQFVNSTVMIASNDRCPLVNTLNFQKKIVRDVMGHLMCSENEGEMVACVHQIDRVEEIWKYWEPKFKPIEQDKKVIWKQ